MSEIILFLMSREGVLALLTGFFTFLALLLFIKDFRRGKSTPYLWAWVIRVAICGVAFWSQLLQGATHSLALALSQIFVGVCIISLIASSGYTRGKLDKIDWAALGIAAMGVLGWVASGDSLFGLIGVILADSCATSMSIRAAIKKGSRESISFWTCALMAASMAVAAAGTAGWVVILAPLFSCLNAVANILTSLYVRKSRMLSAYKFKERASYVSMSVED
jgi:hypothetical protein